VLDLLNVDWSMARKQLGLYGPAEMVEGQQWQWRLNEEYISGHNNKNHLDGASARS